MAGSTDAPHRISDAQRKSILTTLFISLLLDLISFTFILPLFPRLLDFYRNQPDSTLLEAIFTQLNSFKEAFDRPISSRFDVVLLGGAMGSLFSLLQAVASPVIGALSDRYGRRTALLYSMAGNILSVFLWVQASTFPLFLASRVVGGLSEGNVQLAIAIASDVSTPQNRGSTLALVGVAFSVAFTVGPALGAYLSSKTLSVENPFAGAAAFSLGLLVLETAFLWWKLPETRPEKPKEEKKDKLAAVVVKKEGLALLNSTHLFFLLIFSGMEFSLPFLTFSVFSYTSGDNGRVLGFIGLLASILQGSFVRRAPPSTVVKAGLISSTISFALLSQVASTRGLYVAAAFLAVTSACVVTGLTSLASLRVSEEERGRVLGGFRSAGQLGRGFGPALFCFLYWWAGREVAYGIGTVAMAVVTAGAWRGLKEPEGWVPAVKKVKKKE